MKCLYCDSDSKYKDRTSNKACPSCGHAFAFEPVQDPYKVTDGLFKSVIADVSAKGAHFFTKHQLWYEFNRRLWKRSVNFSHGMALSVFSGVGGVFGAIILASFIPIGVGVCGIAAGVGIHVRGKRFPKMRTPKVAFEEFNSKYVMRWTDVHGTIEKLLPERPAIAKPSADAASDLTAYSFDRAVVTRRRDIAAMLVANRFHFENNCAVLSTDGYPDHIAETVMTMLRRNPNLTVYAVHDASVSGCGLPAELRGEAWFPDARVRIVDLGLRPNHAIKLKLLLLSNRGETAAPQLDLSVEEIAWLGQGWTAELAAMRPAKLLRAMYVGIARASQAATAGSDSGDTVIISGGDGPWISDGGADIGAPDSFG